MACVAGQVVKQTVMTSVYGVTFVGARKQIQNQIEQKLSNGEVSIPALFALEECKMSWAE